MNIAKVRGLKDKEAVIDNNIICDFSELGRMDILNKVFDKILIPKSIVDREVIQHKDSLDYLDFQEAFIETEEGYLFLLKIIGEHGGLTDCDAEVVAIAKEKYVLCTSNEKRIMTTCKENDIESTGSLGILCCAYEHSIIEFNELEELVNRLEYECTCHLSKRIINKVRRSYKIRDVKLEGLLV